LYFSVDIQKVEPTVEFRQAEWRDFSAH